MTYDPVTYWPERHRRYGDAYVAEDRFYERQMKLGALALRGHLPTTGRVLDFGCGTQRFRPVLEDHGLTYDGFDLIPGLGTVECIDEEAYDAVIAMWVLQHIVDLQMYRRVVTTLYSAMKPGGTLVVIDHNPADDMEEHMHPRGPIVFELLYTAGHWRPFDDRHWLGVFAK